MMTSIPIGPSQRDKETGEPDDATSITSGSAGGWEKRPKGPRSQPTQLQSSRSTFSRGSFLSFFAFQEGILSTPISALRGWPTVSGPFTEAPLPYGRHSLESSPSHGRPRLLPGDRADSVSSAFRVPGQLRGVPCQR